MRNPKRYLRAYVPKRETLGLIRQAWGNMGNPKAHLSSYVPKCEALGLICQAKPIVGRKARAILDEQGRRRRPTGLWGAKRPTAAG